jgi:hypothetical protein
MIDYVSDDVIKNRCGYMSGKIINHTKRLWILIVFDEWSY